jgi:glycosyltransferase involved in cell wall biosynthesis
MERTRGGFLCERDDPASLASAILRLLEDREARQRIAEQARQRVVDSYSWPRVAAATADVYAKVIERRRAS